MKLFSPLAGKQIRLTDNLTVYCDRDRNLLRRLLQRETPTANDKAVLQKLERKEILEKTESGYGLQVPLVQRYVEQVVEEEM